MKSKLLVLTVCSFMLGFGSGCSTVDSRIAKNKAAFDTWPAAVQDKVIRGQIEMGFTRDQVAVALGAPDWTFMRTTSDGTTETWAYRDRRPRFGFGVGFASFGHSSATGVGVSTSTGGDRGERLRVNFDREGRVASIEQVVR